MTIHLLKSILQRKTLSFLLTASPAFAEDFYVAQTAAGLADGSSVSNPKDVIFFNTASNLNSPTKTIGKIGPGDCVHLVGTISSRLIIQASGTPTAPIQILFEKDAKLSAPYWPGPKTVSSAGAINVDKKNYITIDGGTNGLIECTDNGDTLANQIDSVGVCGSCANFLTVKNLTVKNMYVRTAGPTQKAFGVAIQDTAKYSLPYTNFRVTNCTISNAYIGVMTDYGAEGADNIEIDHNTITEINWGGTSGDRGGACKLGTIAFHDNRVYNFGNWDDTTIANNWHHNSFFVYANNSGSTVGSIYFYNNHIGPGYNTPGWTINHATSSLYVNGPGMTATIYVFNNLFQSSTTDYPSNGHVYIWGVPKTTAKVYNNTFINGDSTSPCISIDFSASNFLSNTVQGGGSYYAANNLTIGGTAFYLSRYNVMSLIQIDYNFGYNLRSGNSGYSYSLTNSGAFKSFADWQALGYDLHGGNIDPQLDAVFMLKANSPAIGAGTNLSDLFDTDKLGAGRPLTGPWDIGAFAYAPPGPPANVRTKIRIP